MLSENQRALGWKEGTVAEFLGLSDAESQLVEIKLAMTRALKAQRERVGLSQSELAMRLETKQPAIARMEKAEGSASLDNVILALLEVGATRREIADLIMESEPPKAKPKVATRQVARKVRSGRIRATKPKRQAVTA